MEGLFTRDISMKHFYTDWDFESIGRRQRLNTESWYLHTKLLNSRLISHIAGRFRRGKRNNMNKQIYTEYTSNEESESS